MVVVGSVVVVVELVVVVVFCGAWVVGVVVDDGWVVGVVVDVGSEACGADIGNFDRFETLGCAAPAGPLAKARKMFSVTFWSLHTGVDGAPAGHASTRRGDHPKVAAANTPAPLEAEYHVLSA